MKGNGAAADLNDRKAAPFSAAFCTSDVMPDTSAEVFGI